MGLHPHKIVILNGPFIFLVFFTVLGKGVSLSKHIEIARSWTPDLSLLVLVGPLFKLVLSLYNLEVENEEKQFFKHELILIFKLRFHGHCQDQALALNELDLVAN